MKIDRQIAFISVAPLFFLALGTLYGALGGWSGSIVLSIVTSLAVLGLSGVLSFILARGLLARISHLKRAAARLSEGDAAGVAEIADNGDDLGSIAGSLKKIKENFESSGDSGNATTATREATFKSAAFSGSSVAMMMVDRDFTVTYVNESTKQLLAENAQAFREIWPSFDPNAIVGSCIDMFHKNPAHQRQLLSDPSRLPYQTEITVGDLKFALNVSGIFDAERNYVGNVLEWADVTEDRLNSGKLDALSRSQAIIEFSLDGTIVEANENFLNAMGYSLGEIQGQHHSMFVEPDYKESSEYRSFWDALRRGEFQSGTYKRFGKGGREIWIQASYNPILDANGKPFKFVKFAVDVTDAQLAAREATFKSSAFAGSSVAMMMVDRDFMVTYVNESTKELLAKNTEAFREIWPSFDPNAIVGSCIDMFHKNPAHQRQLLSDPSRLPYRTDITVGDFKFALNVSAVFDAQRNYVGNVLEWADVTTTRMNAGMLDALDRSQAVIEFSLDGTILNANQNFLSAMGYSLDEVRGQHHSIFVEQEYKNSTEYRAFWDSLARGEYQSDEYQRVAKGGREIWIQASYNPILDGNGNPFKVVKFASDITDVVMQRRRDEAERQERAAALALVVENLADGLNRLSQGDFSSVIESVFAEEYEQLRGDFNSAVMTLKEADAERKERAAAQALVVDNLATGMKALAEGNLTARIDTEFTSDYEQLRRDFNGALEKIQGVMTIIVKTADGISNGAGEISRSADELSKRTEDQAGTLEQTAAALDQITATVKQTADGANEANSVGDETRKSAQQSGEVVREAVSAMGEIENSSKQISQIIGVIDDIAFQTNLLALNAGVEAARAGDAGRGFAVVAQEVRALAQRSSDAAKEIKGLISASSQHVSTGVDLVGKAGEALEEIVTRVENVSNLVSEIAASAKEQSASLSEVNTAVNKMDKVTQQNAAMVEESTAASHSLTKDSSDLMRQISHFNIGGERRRGRGDDEADSPAANGSAGAATIASQQNRAAAFAAAQQGSAALKVDHEPAEDDWKEF